MSDAVDLLKKAYDAFAQGNIEELLSFYADDAEWVYPEIEGVPQTGRRQGRDEIAQFFGKLGEVEEVLDFQQNQFIGEGDNVVVLGTYKAKAKATGRTWKTDYVHVATVSGGKIQSFKIFADTAAAAAAYR